MSCASGAPTYRLLDYLVGWDYQSLSQLTDPDNPAGIQLAPLRGDGPDRADFLPWLPDSRLAPGCGSCAWYLVSGRGGLLRLDTCGSRPAWPPGCDQGLGGFKAISAREHLLAAATEKAACLWRREGEQLAAVIPGRFTALAIAPWGELLLAREGTADLDRYDLAGSRRGCIVTGMTGPVEALTTGRGLTPGDQCDIWALTGDGGTWQLWRGTRGGQVPFLPATLDDLAGAVDRTGLTAVTDEGFCLTAPGPDGVPVTSYFGWDGVPVDSRLGWDGEPAGASPVAPALQTAGLLLTKAIDSGQPRCRWHRVRVDADVPQGTSVQVAVSTSEYSTSAPLNAGDWQQAGPASADFLVDQPPGRYLYLRLDLAGNGTATPVVHRIRLDFPRITSASELPAVYLQDPAAADFTERFMSLFDAAFDDADRAVERYPALLDPGGVPDEVLPWLGGLLGLSFDPGWNATIRRNLLAAAPALYRKRGTATALQRVIKIVFGIDVTISELAAGRSWAALGRTSQLRSTRLYGRSRARFRVGSSALSAAPVHSFGNPDDDPLTAQANRIRVIVPPSPGRAGPDPVALRQLVTSQAPAHTVAEVQLGGLGLVVGVWSAVGVDTVLAPLPAPVLEVSGPPGAVQPVALGRHSVLWPSARGPRSGMRPGAGLAVGMNTVAQ